jgi:hypothetical protein
MRLIPGPAGHVDLSVFNGDDDGDDYDDNEADASHGHHRRRVDSSSSAVSIHAVKEVFLSVSN